MKKIYMILAAITLLSLSLNAQTTYQKVTSTSDLTNGEYLIVSEAYSKAFNGALTGANLNSASNPLSVTISNGQIASSAEVDAAVFTIDFTAGTIKSASGYYIGQTSNANGMVYSETEPYTNTITLDATSTNVDIIGSGGAYLRYNNSAELFRYYKSSSYESQKAVRLFKKITSTPTATLTAPVNGSTVNVGTNTGNGVNKTINISGSNLTQDLTIGVSGNGFSVSRDVTVTAAEANAGKDITVTYNGTDANATGTLTISSSEISTVTVNLTASYNGGGSTPSGSGTVGSGTTQYNYLPAAGYYQDYGYKNQMIYSATQLAEIGIQPGDQITSITFYPTTYSSGYSTISGINFSGSQVTLSLGNTDVSSFSGSKITPDDLTDMVTISPVVDTNATTWTFSWDTPFTYTGDNLLVQVYCPGYSASYGNVGPTGSYGQSYFKGDNRSSNVSIYSTGSTATGTSGSNSTFQPQATFTFEANNTPALTAPTDGSTVDVGESLGGAAVSKTITVSGRNLTEALTVSVSGTGFTVSPTTLSAADVNAGTATVTVTYAGTANGTGTLTITSGDTGVDPVTVNLTATYVDITPVLTDPVDESTVNVGTNTGSGVSKTINIKGNYLTQDLTVSVSGTGFSVSRDVTVTAAEANAGQDITVTYNGTNENATGTLTISSSEVNATVNLTASYSESGEITVANGTDTDMYLPVYGSYYEQVQMNQMIYPASMLSDMEGKYITSITFYPASGTTSGGSAVSGIAFSGGKVMLSLGSTTNNSFTSNTAISATVEQVAEIDDVQADQTLTAWTFTFDTPYLYEGGNLLLQVDTEAGSYYRTFFYGTTMSNMGRHQCSGDGGNALHNFLPKATFTYSSTAPLPPAVEGGLLRLHLLFCDQLKANIPDDNKHPDAYGYVLKFEPQGGETQESGTVKVDIQKTDCEVMGYYTLDQIDRDTNRGLTMDVLTADVQFDLTATNDMLNYYYLQGKENGYPELDKDYLSQLHRQEDFTYREMYEDSYEFDQVFNSGEHHYFNSAAEPIIGQYGVASKFVSYAPSVTTWGIQRRYFELDGKDNTYGAPVWKTAVGKVEMDSQAKPVVERQTNSNNSVNWGSGDNAASLYMLDNVKAIGYLPPTNLTKVEFEPYMFRIFVESKNGLLRPYKVVPAVEGSATEGEHLEAADGELTEADMKGPICVWSGYIKYDNDGNPIDDAVNGVELSYNDINGPFTYLKNKVDRDAGYDAEGNPLGGWDKDSNNAMFGALDALAISGYDAQGKPILNNNITEDDLKIFVRFYYSVKGELADHTVWSRTEGSRSGNGAESGGKAPDPATGVNEIVYHGEIVETIYYNVQGMMSDKPFEGVNIIVNRYSDGTSSVSKVVK